MRLRKTGDKSGAKPEKAAPETAPETGTAAFTATALDRMRRKKKRRRLLRKLAVRLAILGVLVFLGVLTWNKLRADYRVEYNAATATVGSITNALSYSGNLQLIDSKTYTAAADGKVREVYVERNQKVTAGTKLMRVGATVYTADFDGTVDAVSVAAGDEVGAGDTLLKLVDYDHMRVNIRISAANIHEVEEGTDCRVTVSWAGAAVNAKIGVIDFSTYSGNNTVYYSSTVDVDLTGVEGVKPGMIATVTVTKEEAADAVILKADAISTAPDNTAFVYKQQADGSMAASPVTLGVSNGSYTEIREGVAAGETVYVIAAKDESQSGWASVLSSMFGSQQVNRPVTPGSWNRNSGGWGGGNSGGSGGGNSGGGTQTRNRTPSGN